MKLPITRDGIKAVAGGPLKLVRYDAAQPPDPADLIDCLFILNDRKNGIPRARLVISNGGSYDNLAYLTDIPAPQTTAPAEPAQIAWAQPVPLTREPVALPAPVVYNDADIRKQVDDLTARVAALEDIIDALNAVAKNRIKAGA